MQPDPELPEQSGDRAVGQEQRPAGQLIAERYEIVKLLGSGAMGDVYEVEHRGIGRRFALKVLRADLGREPAIVARFEREARAVARLSSEHIVTVVDAGIDRGAPYFVMERLYGQELRQLLKLEGTLPLQRALHVALDVCHALSVAHAAGVIHRDLKPENLFIVRSQRGPDVCKVLDFGVAKLTGENPTLPGTLVGTARYMAPEQIGSSSEIGPATDLFALGVILFECLTGEPPFGADTLERVLFKIVNEPAPSLTGTRPDLPSELARLLERVLAKAPADRPQSAAALAEALLAFTLSAPGAFAADDATQLDPSRGAAQAPRGGAVPTKPRLASVAWLGIALGVGIALGFVLGRNPLQQRDSTVGTAPVLPASASAPIAPEPPSTTTSAASPVDSSAPPKPESAKPSVAHPQPRLAATPSNSARPAKPPLFFPQDAH